MQDIRLDSMVMDRERFLNGGVNTVFLRKNTDPNARGLARRVGTLRLTDSATAANIRRSRSLGLSAHPGVASYALLDDKQLVSLQTVFAANTWSINFHITVGALVLDTSATCDFPLFRWGVSNVGNAGIIEIGMRTDSNNLRIYARFLFDTATPTALELLYTLSPLPDPTDDRMITVRADATTLYLDVDGENRDSDAFAVANRTIPASSWTEMTLLGRTQRALNTWSAPVVNPLVANDLPGGRRPTITDLSIWDKSVTLGTDVVKDQRLSFTTAPTGLILYAPLNDGALRETVATYYNGSGTLVDTGRFFLVPDAPVVDSDKENGGVIFSGEGGHVRIPYHPGMDPLFTRRGQVSQARPWALQTLVIMPGSQRYPDGDAMLWQIGSTGATLVKLLITDDVLGYNHFRAVIGQQSGVDVTLDAALNIVTSADTRYLITVVRTETTAVLVVLGNSTGMPPTTDSDTMSSPYGPEFDEDYPPEVYGGAAYDPTTDAWSAYYRGRIKRVLLLDYALPLTTLAAGAKDIETVNAMFYHRFRRALGEVNPDEGPFNMTAFLEADPR